MKKRYWDQKGFLPPLFKLVYYLASLIGRNCLTFYPLLLLSCIFSSPSSTLEFLSPMIPLRMTIIFLLSFHFPWASAFSAFLLNILLIHRSSFFLLATIQHKFSLTEHWWQHLHIVIQVKIYPYLSNWH